jgi:hypothetical protein
MKNKERKYVVVIGIILAFFVSTILLHFILNYFDKLPRNWGYFHILGTVLLIFFIGILIKLWFGEKILK